MELHLLDANILLEILLNRPKSVACQELLDNGGANYIIAALTVHIVWYVSERYHIDSADVRSLLGLFGTIPLDQAAINQAGQRYDGKDFEDCLQAACAEAAGCDQIVTLDKRFAQHSGTKLPVRVL